MGQHVAATNLGDVPDMTCFPNRDHFAAYIGEERPRKRSAPSNGGSATPSTPASQPTSAKPPVQRVGEGKQGTTLHPARPAHTLTTSSSFSTADAAPQRSPTANRHATGIPNQPSAIPPLNKTRKHELAARSVFHWRQTRRPAAAPPPSARAAPARPGRGPGRRWSGARPRPCHDRPRSVSSPPTSPEPPGKRTGSDGSPPGSQFATYMVRPSGMMAMSKGYVPTLTGLPAVVVAAYRGRWPGGVVGDTHLAAVGRDRDRRRIRPGALGSRSSPDSLRLENLTGFFAGTQPQGPGDHTSPTKSAGPLEDVLGRFGSAPGLHTDKLPAVGTSPVELLLYICIPLTVLVHRLPHLLLLATLIPEPRTSGVEDRVSPFAVAHAGGC